MKNTKYSFTSNRNRQPHSAPQVTPDPQLSKYRPRPAAPPGISTTARDYANPVDYKHPFPSMAQFADLLALRYDANRTRHSYYRQLRLIHQHFSCDPSTITEAQLREYFLFVKLKKHWKPKSIRQALASARVFFVELLSKPDWSIFSQIRAKDHDTLPAVLTRQQVRDLLAHTRRYLRHVLPAGLRSIRYYGFCHPTAKTSRMRVQLHSGRALEFGTAIVDPVPECSTPTCPRCGQPTQLLFPLGPFNRERGPPADQRSEASTSSLAA